MTVDNFCFSISIKLDIDNYKKFDLESWDILLTEMFHTSDRTIITNENILKVIESFLYSCYSDEKYQFYISDFFCVKNLFSWQFSVCYNDYYDRKTQIWWWKVICYSWNELYELWNLIK